MSNTITSRYAIPPYAVRRIAFIKPCCLGDLVMATALLGVVRRAYPDAHITWFANAGGSAMLRDHTWLDAVMDTGKSANPAKDSLRALLAFSQLVRTGKYDLAIIPDRSPLLMLATLLAGIPYRAGLNSASRGLFYTHRANIDPAHIEHEALIYLRVATALGLPFAPDATYAYMPTPGLDARNTALQKLVAQPESPFMVVHPGGGVNAGMRMTQKRWPSGYFAETAVQLMREKRCQALIVGAESDRDSVEACAAALRDQIDDPMRVVVSVGTLTAADVVTIGTHAALYLCNDSGLGHWVGAAGGRVVMVFGPSDPRRYAPLCPPDRVRVVWRPVTLNTRGVQGDVAAFDWARVGVSVSEVLNAARTVWR